MKINNYEVSLTRRRYGTKTYTWASVEIDGKSHDIEGDPWPAVTPKKSELEEAVKQYVQLFNCRYFELREKVLPYLEAYQEDLLKCDREFLLRFGDSVSPYIHVARRTGTELYVMHPAEHEAWPADGERVKYLFSYSDRWHILKQNLLCLESTKHSVDLGDDRLVHWFNGKTLKQVDINEAIRVCRNWMRNVESKWLSRRAG